MLLSLFPASAFYFSADAYADSVYYNPYKAASYARDSSNVNGTSGACATFVRRCLKYGGLTNIGSISTTGDLKNFVVNNGYGKEYAVNDTNLKFITPGDIVEVYGSSGIKHVILVTDVNYGDKYIRYSAKNNDHCNEKMSFGSLKKYHTNWSGGKSTKFLHMNDTAPRSSAAAASATYNGHTYERYDYNLSWNDAKAFCEQRGGYLATITSSGENDFVVSLLGGCPLGYYHIGATDPGMAGNWSWITGETFSYNKWDPQGEPSKGSGEYYAAIIGFPWPGNKQIGEWIDEPDRGGDVGFYCFSNGGFVCEYPSTYTVSYNANGGTGAPSSQTKTELKDLTLSNTTPTRTNSTAGSYTVTLNANGGNVSPSVLNATQTTSYSFKNWNTNANGSGTTYNPGGTYSKNENATLYAQWNSSTTTAAVTLPTPSRTGFSFLGWATSAGAATGQYQAGASYTPSGNITLYAVWLGINYNKSLKLPASLGEIGQEAFAGLTVQEVVVPQSVKLIGKYAFADCTALQLVEFNSADVSIYSDAFTNCPNVKFYAPGGGTVQAFATAHGIPFTAK